MVDGTTTITGICSGNYKDLSIGEISKQLGERWKGMSDEDKQPYEVCTPLCSACTEHVPGRCWQGVLIDASPCTECF